MLGCVRFVHQVATRPQQRDERGDEIAIQEVRHDDAIEDGGTERQRSGIGDDAAYRARSAHCGAHRTRSEIEEHDVVSLLGERARVTPCSPGHIAYQRPARQLATLLDDPGRRLPFFGVTGRITSIPIRS